MSQPLLRVVNICDVMGRRSGNIQGGVTIRLSISPSPGAPTFHIWIKVAYLLFQKSNLLLITADLSRLSHTTLFNVTDVTLSNNNNNKVIIKENHGNDAKKGSRSWLLPFRGNKGTVWCYRWRESSLPGVVSTTIAVSADSPTKAKRESQAARRSCRLHSSQRATSTCRRTPSACHTVGPRSPGRDTSRYVW